jgi:DNA-binding CsgD family transcriptional regulator
MPSQDMQTLKSVMLEAALNALAAGVVFTERNGRVVYMNTAAASQFKTGNALKLFNNRFSPTDPGAARALAAALAGASDGQPAGGRGNTLALPDRDGRGVLATILPLGPTSGRGLGEPAAAMAAIFIQDPSILPHCPGEAFARLYGLTGGELRVALTLMPGLTVQEAAQVLGISLETVKTHLKHIFQKTGTSRQVDLLALMWRTSIPVRGM